jgi:hypothetical protein
MKKLVVLVVVAFTLSGCVSQRMNEGLNNLMGQNIQVAVDRLGYPDGQRTMLGDTIYVWSASHNTMLPMSTTSMTSGSVGTLPVYGTTTNTSFVPANLNCTIQISTFPDKTIKSYQWSGNNGGCSPYANALVR